MNRLWAIPLSWLWAGVGAWTAIAVAARWPIRGNESWGGHLTEETAAAYLSEPGTVLAAFALTTGIALWIAFAKSANNLDDGLFCKILLCAWVLPAVLPMTVVGLLFGLQIALVGSSPAVMALVAGVGFWGTAMLAGWTRRSALAPKARNPDG